MIITITGPSGSGKTTLARRLVTRPIQGHTLIRVVSCTTRSRRIGEIEGVDYYFKDPEEMKGIVARTEYAGNMYGVQIKELKRGVDGDTTVVYVTDRRGASEVKRLFGDRNVLSLAISCPVGTLASRLKSAGRTGRAARVSADVVDVMLGYYDYLVDGDCPPNSVYTQAYNLISRELRYRERT